VDFNGADASTSATDTSDSGHTLTFVGTAQITSNELDVSGGTTDIVTAPDSADWAFGSGDFTIDADCTWSSASAPASTEYIVEQWDFGSNQSSWGLAWTNAGSIGFFTSTNGTASSTPISYSFTPTVSTKYRLRVDKASNVYRLYIDGAFVAKTTLSETLHNSTAVLGIGANSGTTGRQFSGTVDNVRITKGVARTGSDAGYTTGTGEYPTALGGTTLSVSANPFKVPSYTVATMPDANPAGAGVIIYVTDETGGSTLAVSDGTDWRRMSDRAIVA
jgi:hypothetical protein